MGIYVTLLILTNKCIITQNCRILKAIFVFCTTDWTFLHSEFVPSKFNLFWGLTIAQNNHFAIKTKNSIVIPRKTSCWRWFVRFLHMHIYYSVFDGAKKRMKESIFIKIPQEIEKISMEIAISALITLSCYEIN